MERNNETEQLLLHYVTLNWGHIYSIRPQPSPICTINEATPRSTSTESSSNQHLRSKEVQKKSTPLNLNVSAPPKTVIENNNFSPSVTASVEENTHAAENTSPEKRVTAAPLADFLRDSVPPPPKRRRL